MKYKDHKERRRATLEEKTTTARVLVILIGAPVLFSALMLGIFSTEERWIYLPFVLLGGLMTYAGFSKTQNLATDTCDVIISIAIEFIFLILFVTFLSDIWS